MSADPRFKMDFETLSMRQKLALALSNPFRNTLLPTRFLRWLVRTSRSPLIHETLRRPGGWPSMRILHENQVPVDILDFQALRASPLCMETRNRRKIVVQMLTEMLDTLQDQSPVQVVGVGAGPGWHLQQALSLAGRTPDSFQVFLLDLDPTARDAALEEARARGFSSSVIPLTGDARAIEALLPGVRPHLVKLVGILEYLTDSEVSELLRALHAAMPSGGHLLTHGLVDRYHQGPFLARTFGLRHHYRTASQMEVLLRDAGFQLTTLRETPLRIFPICQAIRGM